jgi:hypothetical protein
MIVLVSVVDLLVVLGCLSYSLFSDQRVHCYQRLESVPQLVLYQVEVHHNLYNLQARSIYLQISIKVSFFELKEHRTAARMYKHELKIPCVACCK